VNNVPNKKILIIEDDESTRHLLVMFLQKFPVAVLHAESVDEGKSLLDQNNIALVICDYHLGDNFGTDVLTHLRKRKSETPFILYTSEEFTRIPHVSYLQYSYIQKPEVDALLIEVEKWLQRVVC
jgi:DNA-binding response OmpR family regulator